MVLNFHNWIAHRKITDPYFLFSLNDLPLWSYAPFEASESNFVMKISRKLLKLGVSKLVSWEKIIKRLPGET